jgi:hypothetical protein
MLQHPGVALARAQRALVRAQRLGVAAPRHVAQLGVREFRRLPVALHERALGLAFGLRRLSGTRLDEDGAAE